jgi:hypothetical protein
MHPSQSLPSALVTIDKKFGRQVMVGAVDGNRQLTNGFTADYPTTIHYRTLPHGPFSILVGTRFQVEVRVMMDGKLLCEQFLNPLPAPRTMTGSKSTVVRRAAELSNQAQPFFISFDDQGNLLSFDSDPLERSSDELLRLQLHPEPLNAQGGVAPMHLGELPSGYFDAVHDLPPIPFGAQAPAGLAPLAVASQTAPARQDLDQESDATAGDKPAATDTPAVAAPMVPAIVDATGTIIPGENHHIQAPVPEHWAPSHGLVAIGVRMVQVHQEGEPMLPPDGFEYVLFQFNTWQDHARIRANLHSRIKLPPRFKFPEHVGDVVHTHGPDEPCTCGNNHGHNPRRFR